MSRSELESAAQAEATGAGARPRSKSKVTLRLGVMAKLVGFQVRRAQLVIYEDFMRTAPVQGLTPGQFAILIVIAENAKLTQQRLSEGLGIDKSTLAVRLHRLAERGLIRRVRSPTDRRENMLELTARGQSQLRAMLSFVTEHERRVTSKLTYAEGQQLMTLLRKIR